MSSRQIQSRSALAHEVGTDALDDVGLRIKGSVMIITIATMLGFIKYFFILILFKSCDFS